MRCSVPAWSWNVDDNPTSTSGSSPGGGVQVVDGPVAGRRAPDRRSERWPGPVPTKSNSAEVSTHSRAGAVGWSMKWASGSSPRSSRSVLSLASPLSHMRWVIDRTTPSRARPGAPLAGLRPSPNGVDPLAREQVDVRHQHVERDGCRLGGDHRPEGELGAQHDVRAVLGDRRVDVGGVLAQRPGELLLEQAWRRAAADPLHSQSRYGSCSGCAVGPVGRLDPPPERGAGRRTSSAIESSARTVTSCPRSTRRRTTPSSTGTVPPPSTSATR